MGLDSVELIMATEEHFEIEIPDRIAETLFTAGSLHEFVVSELQRIDKPRDAGAVFIELREPTANTDTHRPQPIPNIKTSQ